MNRKNLTSAVLAGLAGVAGIAASAQAVNLNPDGLGQVLIYPYYTTRNGNQTLLSVVNTTADAKAVKVRFMEGKNTREVLDFNLYLSPYDVWTAALLDGSAVDTNCDIIQPNGVLGLDGNPITGADGGQCGVPHLLTTDSSCTVPYLFDDGVASTGKGLQSFLPFRLGDGGGTDIDRAAEGHFEMIEMGTVTDEDESSATALTHEVLTNAQKASGQQALPNNCDQLVAAWSTGGTGTGGVPLPDGYWTVDPSVDIEAPTGGLFGGAAVVNVGEGYMFSYDAKAINGFQSDADVDALTTLHAIPGTVEPGLNSGDVTDATVFLDDGSTLASSGLTRGVDAVSFVFMHDQLYNEYSIEAGINAFTEWVITFPTKHFYVFEDDSGSDVPLAPFTEQWQEDGPDQGTACEPVLLNDVFDREEQSTLIDGQPGTPPIVSPAPPIPPDPTFIPFELCFETNVIQFAAPATAEPSGNDDMATPILGAKNATTFTLPPGYETGWAALELDDYVDESGAASRDPLGGLEGLPVTGFSVQKFGNQNAQAGIAAFYGGIYGHKASRKAASS